MQPTYYDYLRWLEQQNQVMNAPMNQQQMAQPVNQPVNMPTLAQVANKTAAELYNVLPGQKAILVDMDAPFVYTKERTADNRLMPLEIYDLVKHVDAPVEQPNLDGYVKFEDLNRVVSEEVEKRIKEALARPKKEGKE